MRDKDAGRNADGPARCRALAGGEHREPARRVAHGLRGLKKGNAVFGQTHAARLPVKDRGAQMFLDLADLPTDGRLACTELAARRRKRTGFGHRKEDLDQ